MSDEEQIGEHFGVSHASCDQCQTRMDVCTVRIDSRGDADWPIVMLLCTDCLRDLRNAITAHINNERFSNGEEPEVCK